MIGNNVEKYNTRTIASSIAVTLLSALFCFSGTAYANSGSEKDNVDNKIIKRSKSIACKKIMLSTPKKIEMTGCERLEVRKKTKNGSTVHSSTEGSGNSTIISSKGKGNKIITKQSGKNNTVTIVQTGSNNNISVTQRSSVLIPKAVNSIIITTDD